jgi:hypothetical protein
VRRIKRTGALKGHDRQTVQSTSRFRLLTLPSLRWRRNTLPKPFGTDLRALGPVHVCPCGSQVFNVMASFEDYELVWYFLDATCVNCGNLVTVPCPVDAE